MGSSKGESHCTNSSCNKCDCDLLCGKEFSKQVAMLKPKKLKHPRKVAQVCVLDVADAGSDDDCHQCSKQC